ncbi:MAG: lysophospholipase [Actinomycetota bacterium]|nr:lysophospholipase [Actinomycetota bacterium]
MLKRLLVCCVAALSALMLAAAAAPATFEGEHAGANYKIVVPDAGWNGTLVVLAHGYRDKADHVGEVDDRSAMDPGFTALANGLAAQGYAVAATSYRDNGWAVKESIHDLTALRGLFNGLVGQPDTALLAGFSLGSLATAELAERAGGLFDGYLPACGVLAGSPRAWDMGAAGLLAYKLIYGLPASWGTPADADNDVDFETEVFPTLFSQIFGATDYGKWEFIRLISGAKGPVVPLPPVLYPSWLFTNFFFTTEARAEAERRAGGPYVQNVTHTYALTASEQAYLATLGFNAAPVLAAMNGSTRFSGERSARNYMSHYATFSGNLRDPVFTLHTKWDTLVPWPHESAYAETVAAAGASDMLRQASTNGLGHCNFSPTQIGASVALLEGWVETGVRPSAATLAAFGLDATTPPPGWPQD